MYRKIQLSALTTNSHPEETGAKKLALLDLLIEAHLKDGSVSVNDIIEEANTFMFEGIMKSDDK